MLLNDIATSDDVKIAKINKVLKETYGFTLVSEIESGTLNTLYSKISDDLYDLKLDLSTVKSPDYMQKVLVLEGLKILIEQNKKIHEALMAGPGGRAYERVNKWLSEFVHNACEVGDDYEEAIRDAMKQYRSSKYRFEDHVVEHDLRKATYECSPEGVDEYVRDAYGDEVIEGVNEDEKKADKDYDGDGKIESPKDEWKGSRDKAIEKDLEEDKVKESGDRHADREWIQSITKGKEEKKEAKPTFPPINRWYEYGRNEIMSAVYWQRNQLPPSNPEKYEAAWQKIKAQLEVKYPSPVEEDHDRHAEHEWVKDIKKQQGIDDDSEDGLTLSDPEDYGRIDEPEDYFSYRQKQMRIEMKEGHIKKLRRLLEAEVEQAESLIAAKSFSQELQDMVEKLGRLVNENLPAVSEQMRDAYGADVATGFENQVAVTLNAVMDSLRDSKQEIDNSVSTIADGGAPVAVNDMDGFSDEELGGDEFGDEELDLDGDVELELGDEFGDEFGGDDAMAGDIDEPLGRAKKESFKILGKKILETEKKLARIKARK